MAHAAGIAAIYQQPALFPDLSVTENIALALESPSATRLVRWRERRNRAVELLKRVGADLAPETQVRELSMPQQQLVEIARTLGAGGRTCWQQRRVARESIPAGSSGSTRTRRLHCVADALLVQLERCVSSFSLR